MSMYIYTYASAWFRCKCLSLSWWWCWGFPSWLYFLFFLVYFSLFMFRLGSLFPCVEVSLLLFFFIFSFFSFRASAGTGCGEGISDVLSGTSYGHSDRFRQICDTKRRCFPSKKAFRAQNCWREKQSRSKQQSLLYCIHCEIVACSFARFRDHYSRFLHSVNDVALSLCSYPRFSFS